MTVTAQTYWDVDGESLQTYAWNITTLGGDRLSPPPVRGSDLQVPYAIGARWVPRQVDSRTITLGMWVVGANPDGSIPTGPARLAFDENWRKIRRLLWRPRSQFVLTKRFWLPTSDLESAGVDTSGMTTLGDWSLYQASAQACFAGGLSPAMNGPNGAAFTVDLNLSDPFFYGDEIEIPFSTTSGGSYPGPDRTVPILGDDRTMNIEVDFAGPLTAPTVTNASEPQSLFLRYAAEVPDDEAATLRVLPFSATHYPSGEAYKVSGNVQHRGDIYWLYLEPGSTHLVLSAQSGTGTAVVRYRPAWF